MRQINKKQIEAINKKCSNGFTFNIQKFIESGEKGLVKNIPIVKDEEFIEATLCWGKEITRSKDARNCSCPNASVNFIPTLRVSIWKQSSTTPCWVSHGLGKYHEFTEKHSVRKRMNELCEVTKLVTDELISSMSSGHITHIIREK